MVKTEAISGNKPGRPSVFFYAPIQKKAGGKAGVKAWVKARQTYGLKGARKKRQGEKSEKSRRKMMDKDFYMSTFHFIILSSVI